MSRLRLVNSPYKAKNVKEKPISKSYQGKSLMFASFPTNPKAPQNKLVSNTIQQSALIAKLGRNRFSLNKSKKNSDLSLQKPSMQSVALEEVIKSDDIFGPLLSRVKKSYENYKDSLQKTIAPEQTIKIKKEIESLKTELEGERMHQQEIMRKIHKFDSENKELVEELETKEERYTEMQDSLLKISMIDLSQVSRTKSNWEDLVLRNKKYAEKCKKIRKKNKELRRKDKNMMKLVKAIKKRGIPIETFFATCAKKPKQTDSNQEKNQEVPIKSTENMNIVEGVPIHPLKPPNVPDLNLEERVYDSNSSSISDKSSQEFNLEF